MSGFRALLDPFDFRDIFINSSATEDDEGPDRNSRVGLPSASPGPVFFPMGFPTAIQRSDWATQELSSFPGRELVPHLALPTPGVAPDVDTTELVPDIIVPWHRLIPFVTFSFVYNFVYCFNYTLSNSRLSIGVLRNCISIQGLLPSPNSISASCPPPFRSHTTPLSPLRTRWPRSPRASRPSFPRHQPTS